MKDNHKNQDHSHHILPNKIIFGIGILLLIFTVITVAISRVDLGAWNFPVAMLVATFKASLVALVFMGLKWDSNENRVIFFSSLVFLSIFIILTSVDVFFRQPIVAQEIKIDPSKAVAKFQSPWKMTPEILNHGKGLFEAQCVSCHGSLGKGDGPASSALNPKPRNFTLSTGWLKTRKPSQVFDTLTKGVGSMPAFGSLPAEDRWSLAHYVLSLGEKPLEDTDSDLKQVGVDPLSTSAASAEVKEISVDLAIEILSEEAQSQ